MARLLCDAMLARLARYLRAAGHDTRLASGERDSELVRLAVREDRLLLSRDRALAEHRAAADRLVILSAETLDDQARELRQRPGLDWLHAPFTRCLIDNTPLEDAAPEQVASLPPRVRARGGPFRSCPTCGRVYWPGDHYRQMADRLERWQRTA